MISASNDVLQATSLTSVLISEKKQTASKMLKKLSASNTKKIIVFAVRPSFISKNINAKAEGNPQMKILSVVYFELRSSLSELTECPMYVC
jgi:hypothetical protein